MKDIEQIKRYIAKTKLSYDPRWDLSNSEFDALYNMGDFWNAVGLAYDLGMAREHRRLKMLRNAKKC